VTIADLCPATSQLEDLPSLRWLPAPGAWTEMQMSMPIVRRIH
jgi:hypothetical protein